VQRVRDLVGKVTKENGHLTGKMAFLNEDFFIYFGWQNPWHIANVEFSDV